MTTHGRNRDSVADLEQELHTIFQEHPESTVNQETGEYVVPANALVDVIRVFSDMYGFKIMTEEELDQLKQLISSVPGMEVSPGLLLEFIAQKTKSSPEDETIKLPRRGRHQEREYEDHGRSSSNDSVGTSTNTYSRPSSRSPQTPRNGFDSEKRQRSTPLGGAPSSWTKRPAPAHRRKSDAGSNRGGSSDSEASRPHSFSGPPTSFGRGAPGRSRAPSNPTSPSVAGYSPEPYSRPHSRTQSQPQTYFNDYSQGRDEPRSPEHRDAFLTSVSSMPMPRSNDSDYGDEDEEGLVLDMDMDQRSILSSNASMEPQDRLEVLQRANAELGRKLNEAERTLQNKLADHEVEVEELQNRMEDARVELSAAKREEKELRSKERQNSSQIGELETEIAKLQKAVENARSTHQSLQKQYMEQLSESEQYRNALRRRDEEVKDYVEAAALHQLEINKFLKENEKYEERIAHLVDELALAQQAHEDLDKQKGINIELKETIDRARFELDILRNRDSQGGGSGTSSVQGSVGKSLGAELKGKMSGKHGVTGHDESDEEGDESTEGEEEYLTQTIVTRKKQKRKVAGRNRPETTSATFEETKEYCDASVQHDTTEFTASGSTQTEPEPEPVVVVRSSFSMQTDEPELEVVVPLPPRVTVEMEIQTEEPSRSPSPTVEDDDAMASSSSTVLPPTPKASTSRLHPSDSPPAYHQVSEQDKADQEWRSAADMLRKWHPGSNHNLDAVPEGLSEDAVEEWKALKKELGVECAVIDKIVASSQRRPSQRTPRKGRFYNIYNTYVYGSRKDGTPPSFPTTALTQLLMCVGASAVMCIAMAPFMVPHYSVPGGPTYHDRVAWSSFNSMRPAGEGFSPDGTAAVWNFLGRVGDGAVRLARGWPT